MLILDKIDLLIKWAVLSAMFIGLSFVAACAERSVFSTNKSRLGPTQSALVAPIATPRRAPKGPAPTSAAMMGKDAATIENLLGAPTLLREETGAQIWQYANVHCVLLLYLYEDGGQLYRVAHLEARIQGALNDNVDVCLAATYNT